VVLVLDAALFDNSFFILIGTLTLRLVDLFEDVLDGGAGGETFMVLDLPLPSFFALSVSLLKKNHIVY
jgi:hypothetical protein